MRPLRPPELHDTDRPSATAQWTTFSRALELERPDDERIVTDRYAPLFLSTTARTLLAPLRTGGTVVRLAERSRYAGLSASALCRHRFIDVHLLETLPDVEQVMILGAGYDSRAYRFSRSIGSRPVFEVDLPPLSRAKRQIVDEHADTFGPRRVISVEIDFRTQTLEERLAASGFRLGAATFVAWEGVSMYLTPDAVRATLASLETVCGAGSVLAMDFWQRVRGLSPYDQLRRLGTRAMALIGEPIDCAVPSGGAAHLLDEQGWALSDLATAGEMTRRYATAGRRCDEGMYVVAARLG